MADDITEAVVVDESTEGVTGDDSVAYGNWKDYEKAVELGEEKAPEVLSTRRKMPGIDYEFNVDKALDGIDLRFTGYRPSKDAFEFFTIIRLVLGKDPEVDNSIMHYFLVDMVFGNVKPEDFPYPKEITDKIRINKKKIAVIASRFSAKSTILTAFMPIYCAITGKIPNFGSIMFWVAFGDSQQSGAKVQANAVRDFCIDSPFCKNYFEKMRFTDEECEFIRKGEGRIKDRAFMFKVKGAAGGSVRGIRYKTERPQCHEVGTEVTTDLGTMNVEDYPNNHGVHEDYGVEVSLRGLTDTEKVTVDHKYWAKKCTSTQVWSKESKKLVREYTEESATWIEVKNLNSRYWVGSPIDTKVSGVAAIPHSQYSITDRDAEGHVISGTYTEVYKVPEYFNDDEWWWLYGLWLGDGQLHGYKKGIEGVDKYTGLAWSVAHTQPHISDRIHKFFKKYSKSVSTIEGIGCDLLIASSTPIAKWLAGYKRGNSIKDMPDWVLKLDLGKQKNILLGYIAADGYIDNKKVTQQVRINSVNIVVLKQLQVIASRLGVPSYIRNTKKAGHQLFTSIGKVHAINHQWELRMSEHVADVLGLPIVGSNKVHFKQVHISNGFMWRQVKTVEDCGTINVVPITCTKGVNGDPVNTYRTAFGLSHNCFSFDDVIKNEAEASSTVIMAKLNSMIYSDADKALGKKGKVIIVNTPFNKNDPVYSALESGVWTPLCIPLCERISLGMSKDDYVGSWEAMKSYEEVMEDYEDAHHGNTLREFNQELMLRIADKGSRLIDVDNLQFVSRRVIMDNIDNYNIYVTTDYTASNTRKGDFSGTFEWAVSSIGEWFLLNISLKKMGIVEQYEPVIDIARKWQANYNKLVTVGVELDGQQQINIEMLKKLKLERKVNFLFARQLGAPYESRGITRRKAGGNKHSQFMRVHPLFQEGSIYFCEELIGSPDWKELLTELTYITHSGISSSHDDGLDCISMLPMMDIHKPTYVAPIPVKKKGHQMWGFDDEFDDEPSGCAGY